MPTATPTAAPFRRVTRDPRPWRARELAGALAIVALVDVATWSDGGALGGPGAALIFGLLPFVLVLAAPLPARRSLRSPGLWLVAAMLLATVVRLGLAPSPAVALVAPLLTLAFALALRRPRTAVLELAGSAAMALAVVPTRLHGAARGIARVLPRLRVAPAPILVPLGLVVVFGGVFALANPVVADLLAAAAVKLTALVALPPIARVLLWAAALGGALVLLRPALVRRREVRDADAIGEASDPSLLVARNTLLALVALFFAYDALDARYLWAGAAPAGMTTQDYARSGAFWLTVALFLLTLVVGVTFKGALAHDPRAALVRRLALVWVGEGVVLALGTYRRIAVHIATSGLSDLRIVGILGTSLVLVGLALVVHKLRRGRSLGWLVRRQLDAFAIVLVAYALLPTHLLSAEVNVARIGQGEYRPLLHAFRQSHEAESAAVWIPLLEHADPRVRQGVAALLEEERERLATERDEARSWRQRDPARVSAAAALDAAAPRIRAALDGVAPDAARTVLYTISRSANQGATLEELLAIPAATRTPGAVEGGYVQ